MPQIYILMDSETARILRRRQLEELAPYLVGAVEDAFDLRGLDDVAITVSAPLIFTKGELDVQIEVRYTAGEDEYDRGVPFDPTLEEQKQLCERVRDAFWTFLHRNGIPKMTVSVWCKPFRGSAFLA